MWERRRAAGGLFPSSPHPTLATAALPAGPLPLSRLLAAVAHFPLCRRWGVGEAAR